MKEDKHFAFEVDDQSNMIDAPAGVVAVLECLGYPDAFVTDESLIPDFGGFTDESEKHCLTP